MNDIKKKMKDEIISIHKEGIEIFKQERENQKHLLKKTTASKNVALPPYNPINTSYQSWFTKTLPLVKKLLPDRFQEFQDQYKLQKRDEKKIDSVTFTIYDYLLGVRIMRGEKEGIDHYGSFASRFRLQLAILGSGIDRIDSKLTDIEGILQSKLFDHELEAAEDLLKKGHTRAAGALSGVSLEVHLGSVCTNHNIKISKKSPTISDFNEALKTASVIDVPTWRLIQRLGDIRNLCVHAKERDPTTEEVSDLLIGTKKTIATLF